MIDNQNMLYQCASNTADYCALNEFLEVGTFIPFVPLVSQLIKVQMMQTDFVDAIQAMKYFV